MPSIACDSPSSWGSGCRSAVAAHWYTSAHGGRRPNNLVHCHGGRTPTVDFKYHLKLGVEKKNTDGEGVTADKHVELYISTTYFVNVLELMWTAKSWSIKRRQLSGRPSLHLAILCSSFFPAVHPIALRSGAAVLESFSAGW